MRRTSEVFAPLQRLKEGVNFARRSPVIWPLLWLAVYFYPWPTVRPGSDYDIALKNFFLGGLAYAAVPGVAAVVVLVGVLALRRANPPPPPLVSR